MITRFYFDEHMRRSVARGLIQRGYEVIMAVDVDMMDKDDATEHLPCAAEHGMVMVTFDREFAGRTMSKTEHGGLICISERIRDDIGAIISLLVNFAESHSHDEVVGQVFWLKPLQ